MSRWRTRVLAKALLVVVAAALATSPARAEGPEDPLAPEATYALVADSTVSSSTPTPTTSEPEPSSLTTENSDAPAAASAVSAEAGDASAPVVNSDVSATPKSESPPASKPQSVPVKKSRRASSAPKKPTSAVDTAKPAIADAKSKGATHPDPSDEGARVRREVERTEPILRTVRTKVARSFNKKAREEFEIAATRQREAREALRENLYARADRLTMEARSLARETAVHLGPPQDDPDYVSMTLDRTDDALGRAREVLREAGDPAERSRLAALERRQKEARRLHKDGATRRAYASTREVRDGVLTLLRDCDDLPVAEETAEKALKRASRSLDQAKGELGERLNVTAERLAREARAQMAKAKAAFARKNYRDTLLHSKLVERNLELAVSAQRSPTNRSG